MSKLKLIQAGVGGMGKTWREQAVATSADFECVALVDLSETTLREGGEQLGVVEGRRFRSLTDALNQVQADALLTVTPPAVHAEHAQLAFERGLHVLCEKPISTDLATARRMVGQAAAAQRQLMIAQNYRYSAAAQQLKALFDSTPLGTFGHGHIDFFIPADFTGSFRQRMPHVLLVDMAIHHLDLIRFITGKNIANIYARSFNPPWSWYERDAGLNLFMELDGGIPFTYSGDWSGRGRTTSWNGDWRLQCAEGSIHFQQNQLTLARCERWGKNASSEEIGITVPAMNGQVELLKRFAESIRSGQPAETGGEDNLQSFAAVMAGVRSAEEQRVVRVADVF